jgi:hypothetical protein
MNEKNDLEKRVSALEDKIEYVVKPLLFDVAQQSLFPHRQGISSNVLLWLQGRWGMEKRPEAKKILLETAENLALVVPGSWTEEFSKFTREIKK